MENSRKIDNSCRPIATSCCKCSKSDLKVTKPQCAPYLEDAVSKIKDRRGDLVTRQRHLTEKITTMERCIPALMAFNMWTSGQNCDDPPLCKVRQIMNRLSPNSDPTEKLVEKLKSTVESLNMETAELHEKIIEADVALEESQMELDSIVLANEDYEGKLKSLEKELRLNATPSLHSINSEDLICLSKIRQLGEEQIKLRNGIRDLEEREEMFHEQMNRLLTSKEFRKASCGDRTSKKIQELQRNEMKMHCALHEQKQNVLQLKKKLMGTEKELATIEKPATPSTSAQDKSQEKTNPIKPRQPVASIEDDAAHGTKTSRRRSIGNTENSCNCPIPVPIACYDKSSCPSKASQNQSQVSRCSRSPKRSPKTCGLPLLSKSNSRQGRVCASCCKAAAIISESSGMKYGRGDQHCEIPGRSTSGCDSSRRRSSSPCDLDSPCRKCHGYKPCEKCFLPKVSTSCRCSCKGKCAIGASDVPCNCADYSSSTDDEGYKPSANSAKINDQSSTDEEYCECCDCGCEDSEEYSDSCQC